MTYTSESIQKKYPDIYQDLFSISQIVISAPLTIKWNPTGIESREESISLISKTQLKGYIGRNNKESSRNTNHIYTYDIITKSFTKHTFEEIFGDTVNQLTTTIQKYIKGNILGTAQIVIETNKGHGFGFTGTISAIIAGLVSLIGGETYSESDYINLAMELQQIIKPGSQNQERIVGSITHQSSLIKCNNKEGTYEGYQNISNQRGLSYGVLFDGKIIPIDKAHKSLKINQMNSDQYDNMNSGDSILLRTGCITAYQTYTRRLYYGLVDYIINGNDTVQGLSTITQLINQLSGLLSLCYGYNKFIDLITTSIKNHTGEHEGFGLMPIYYGKYGGGYLFVGDSSCHNNIQNTLQKISHIYPNACIEYSADGASYTKGIIIEQDTRKSHYSHYIEEGTLIYQDNKGQIKQGSYDALLKLCNDGILIDCINRKCYVKGKKVTSEQLKSQSTTVEVLYQLLNNSEHRITNNDLESSSYSNQQNQMLGKIILPLKRLTKELFDEELIIECHGTLRNFELSLQPTTITLGYITKLGQ